MFGRISMKETLPPNAPKKFVTYANPIGKMMPEKHPSNVVNRSPIRGFANLTVTMPPEICTCTLENSAITTTGVSLYVLKNCLLFVLKHQFNPGRSCVTNLQI